MIIIIMFFRTQIKNIYAYTIINTAYQPITREMFEIGSRIRSKNAESFIYDLFFL